MGNPKNRNHIAGLRYTNSLVAEMPPTSTLKYFDERGGFTMFHPPPNLVTSCRFTFHYKRGSKTFKHPPPK